MSASRLSPELIPSVGIGFMDQTHQEEVAMVASLNKVLLRRLAGEQNDIEISRRLQDWLAHTRAHFARENALMQETAFPACGVHVHEHENTLQLMQAVIDDWINNNNIDRLQDFVSNQWPAWFMAHVNSMDKVTAEYALTSGYSMP